MQDLFWNSGAAAQAAQAECQSMGFVTIYDSDYLKEHRPGCHLKARGRVFNLDFAIAFITKMRRRRGTFPLTFCWFELQRGGQLVDFRSSVESGFALLIARWQMP